MNAIDTGAFIKKVIADQAIMEAVELSQLHVLIEEPQNVTVTRKTEAEFVVEYNDGEVTHVLEVYKTAVQLFAEAVDAAYEIDR